MELGFLEREDGGLLLRESTSDYVEWDGGLAGGEQPVWLFPANEWPICGSCKSSMTFMVQIYAPLDDVPSAFHRDLLVFACATCSTDSASVACIRMQMAQENEWYPSESDEERVDEVPDRSKWGSCLNSKPALILDKRYALVVESPQESDDADKSDDEEEEDDDDDGEGQPLPEGKQPRECVVCAKPTNTRCGACHVPYYCSREHQAQDWKAGHKQQCLNNQDAKTSQKDLDQAASFGNQKQLDKLSAAKDRAFKRFVRKTSAYPDQVLRYQRWPKQDCVLWTSAQNQIDGSPPKCENCGSDRRFEMQIMPQFLSYFSSPLEFGTVVVYTCTKSCGKGSSQLREYAFRQCVRDEV